MQRPFASPGVGWIIAVVVLILAILVGIAGLAVPVWLLIAGLALAILLG